ncbi:MAG: glutamine--fructose-6-phosphate transaminase (isomerizing) [Flavobacteriales bacterium]|jgi:glucosamine--fructose-6-phosphate aminotransferase (isomerizing)|tara:strand:+ start:1075 stop:2937 length:1863 start_codon:yes stop_codon:yes gene_type:complete
MCGIVAYVGSRRAYPILIKGLQRLEYRGYDSAGISVIDENKIITYKKDGKVDDLISHIDDRATNGSIGIGHTRWATHGPPNQINSHPHASSSGKLSLIHNGIIENYSSLKIALQEKGYVFKSDTDSEVLIYLIEDVYNSLAKKGENSDDTLFQAIIIALNEVVGAYAIVVIQEGNNNEIYAARKGSPLVIGIGNEEYFVASDASPIIEFTKKVIYLEDGEVAKLHKKKDVVIKNIQNKIKSPYIQELEQTLESIEKGGYDHFMLKEIFEQPKSIVDTLRGRINPKNNDIILGGLIDHESKILKADRIIIIACGTSWHSGLIGEYLIEDLSRINVEVEYASEFRYKNPILTKKDIVIAISQSGETADTLAALELAKEKGALTLGICNVVGSSITRTTSGGTYTHAGPEIGVASTKAFTTQVTVLMLLALRLSQLKSTVERENYNFLIKELNLVPQKIEKLLLQNDMIKEIAKEFYNATNFLYLGRGVNFPVALEGALKLKEISYIHAEGYPAAEMKHGPIALIDEEMPIVVIATLKDNYDKVVSNIQEVKARGGKLIAIVTEGDIEVKLLADYCIEIPKCFREISPLLTIIPLQLLSYHIALLRKCNVDQPRNLAKSVTVE